MHYRFIVAIINRPRIAIQLKNEVLQNIYARNYNVHLQWQRGISWKSNGTFQGTFSGPIIVARYYVESAESGI